MPDHASLALSKELAGVAIQSGTGAQQPKDTIMTTQQILTQIAQRHLHLETLETRTADSLDFHDLAVWSIEAALKAAFEAGRVAGS